LKPGAATACIEIVIGFSIEGAVQRAAIVAAALGCRPR
jgi:hypothetical protein